MYNFESYQIYMNFIISSSENGDEDLVNFNLFELFTIKTLH
jgi:hypothetical protein